MISVALLVSSDAMWRLIFAIASKLTTYIANDYATKDSIAATALEMTDDGGWNFFEISRIWLVIWQPVAVFIYSHGFYCISSIARW